MKILIVDDNESISSILKEYAINSGYEVKLANNGEEALVFFKHFSPDIILLDVMMPKLNGFEVCKRIRETSVVPIIMVTARGEDFERIMGLDIGADDYIVKPFSPSEVMARVRAIMRRIEKPQSGEKVANSHILTFGNLTINITSYEVTVDNIPIILTKKETEILWQLSSNVSRVYSREQLLDILWGYEYFGDSRTVDTHIKRLRAKLDVATHPKWDIKTIWGVGYKFEVYDGE